MDSQQRTHRLKGNIIVILILKGISILISLMYVPLLLGSMDTDNYAVWLTLTSLVSWIALFDIGLGNGLRNRLSETLAKNDITQSKKYISTAYCGVIIVAMFLFISFLIASPFMDWARILNTDTIPVESLSLLVAIVFCSFLLNFVFGLINSILYAVQYPAISTVITFVGQVVSFFTVCCLVKLYSISDIVTLGIIISIVPPIVYLLFTVILFNSKLKYLKPSYQLIDFSIIREILTLGFKFFCLQIITIILFQTNNIIIIHAVNQEAVVIYNILYKYLYILVTVFAMICAPIWSATTEAYVKGDYKWIVQIKNKLLKISALFISAGFLMVVFSKYAFAMWLGDECPVIDMDETFLMFVYCAFMILYSVYGYIINGIGKLMLQLCVTSVLAIIYLPIAYCLGIELSLRGILITMCFIGAFNYLWSELQLSRLLRGTAKGIWNR